MSVPKYVTSIMLCVPFVLVGMQEGAHDELNNEDKVIRDRFSKISEGLGYQLRYIERIPVEDVRVIPWHYDTSIAMMAYIDPENRDENDYLPTNICINRDLVKCHMCGVFWRGAIQSVAQHCSHLYYSKQNTGMSLDSHENWMATLSFLTNYSYVPHIPNDTAYFYYFREGVNNGSKLAYPHCLYRCSGTSFHKDFCRIEPIELLRREQKPSFLEFHLELYPCDEDNFHNAERKRKRL